MRIKGKVAPWFWMIVVFPDILLLYEVFGGESGIAILVLTTALLNLIFLPMAVKNYVEIDGGTLRVVFGLVKDSMKISEIMEVYSTHNPIASSAASLDRIVIKGRRQEMMCAVCDKKLLFQELKRINPGIVFR